MIAAGNQISELPLGWLRRYIPLAVWIIVVSVILLIPLKIISYGYLPGDDALRHAAKAVSGKPWQDILVLGPAFRDQNFAWHFFLRQIHLWCHCGTDGLVAVEVAGLFILLGWSPLLFLKRPEAWLVALMTVDVTSGLMQRLMFGRPFLLTMTGLLTILCACQFHDPSPPKWRNAAWIAVVTGICTQVHGVWYLWALLVAAFFLAGQFRWGCIVATGWLAGTIVGACLSGHPLDSLWYAAAIAQRTFEMHAVERTRVIELRPFGGDIFAVVIFGGLLILRHLGGFVARPLKFNPVFWLACLGWILGFKASRFWSDWGLPALMVLITFDLQLLFQLRFPTDSFKRLALATGLAAMTYLALTSDLASRWTRNLTDQHLTVNNPDLAGWLPEKGGIFYTGDMRLFFQTFFKNPQADWRYIVGFEPALMPDEDYDVYLRIYWNFGDAKAYQPWVDKMKPADRLVIRGGRGSPPNIPQLEWNYGVSGIWIGRLPHKDTNGAPATIPATAPRASAK